MITKKLTKLLSVSAIIIAISFTVACSGTSKSSSSSTQNSNTTQNSKSVNTDSSNKSSSSEKVFTKSELAKYNGQNGNPAYVAVNGVVYDVTNAKNWNNGKHKNGITAGKDLTNELKQSPHGDKVLGQLPVVGKLK